MGLLLVLVWDAEGAGGLTSALRLRHKGYRDIAVFERSAVPGGRAVAIEVESDKGVQDATLLIAAIEGVWGSYNLVTALLQQYRVPIANTSYNGFPQNAAVNIDTHVTNHETGTIIPTSLLPLNRTAISEAAAKYVALYLQAGAAGLDIPQPTGVTASWRLPHITKNLAAFDLDAQERAVFDLVRQLAAGSASTLFIAGGAHVQLCAMLLTWLWVLPCLAHHSLVPGNLSAPFTLSEPPGDGLPALYISWPYTPFAQFYTDYFAHFNVNTLTSTAFAQLGALQGRRGTFFTSSLRSFESQERVVESAMDIVNRYF
ncbi:hypothetical protein COO60DRAFT_1456710 [Scenedesmus sp. NREL 46B-D3]|nr:hypothetical protein COO60DRAFT_1456710 [Scenedesmus sp. NREL 46B-D3]